MRSKFMPIVLAVFMVLATLAPIAVKADSNKTTNLTIHKLKYDTDLDSAKKIKNDGAEKTFDSSILPYDASDYGAIGFTLYRLDSAKTVAKLKEENGNAQAVADKVAADIEGNTTAGLITKVEVAEVKREKGAEPLTMTVNTTTTDGEYFLLVETTSPATVVAKAQPMLLQLPMRSADGKAYTDTVHLYPKNKVDETSREINFEKVVLKVGTNGAVDATTKFEGATFEVYKGKPGNGQRVNNKEGNPVQVTSDANGAFKLTGLKVGNYYLVEILNDKVDSSTASDIKSKDKAYIASFDARNNANNKYAFRMDEDGHVYNITGWDGDTAKTSKGTDYNAENEKMPVIKNSIKPSISKKSSSKAQSIGYSDEYEFEIKVNIPANFGENATDEKIVISDVATEGTIINLNSFKVYDKDGNLKENSKVTAVAVKNKLNEANITVDKNSLLAAGDYSPIYIRYTLKLSKDFVIDADKKITNKVTSKYIVDKNEYEDPNKPVDPENPNNEVPETPNHEVEITSFAKSFKKLDSGLFETGAVKSPLAGADFILGRIIGGKVEYRKLDDTNKYVWTETKAEAATVTSGNDGTFKFEGLAAKTSDGTEIKYFAEEVKAPENYKLPVDEADRKHEFTFTSDANNLIEITNNKAVDAPMTGYEKSVLVIGGLLVMVAAAFVVAKKSKKEVAVK